MFGLGLFDLLVLLLAASGRYSAAQDNGVDGLALTYDMAERMASLPFECYNQEYPYRPQYTVNSTEEARRTPRENHPIFYGCFDWHSSVHGHWLLAAMLNKFPGTPLAEKVINIFGTQFQVS